MTFAFLGSIPFLPFLEHLKDIPVPSFHVGLTGAFDTCLFLPVKKPNVVAWQAYWHDDPQQFKNYIQNVWSWLSSKGYPTEEREWLPHVSICRKPFNRIDWMKAYKHTPFNFGDIHLYESVGNLNYIPLHSFKLVRPFEEIEHTADIAFLVNAENMQQLYNHAFSALAFSFPLLLRYFPSKEEVSSLDEVIKALNNIICRADSEEGCGLKAVCYHGEIVTLPNNLLQWEMIVDV